ncbi:Calcineurin metallo-phosphoesterase superfamily protein [Trifolium repens]|nr:Calcineurin metallo-phosphoesterase superfamily protein [Trifolium repens]
MIIGLRLLSVIGIAFLVIFEDKISTPVCNNHVEEVDDDDLKVMMVADLLLFGSDATYINTFFRDHYMSKFFRKSFESLKPDLLIVLGDVSAKGSKLTKSKWVSVLHQFYQMLGPFVDLPFHAILGDRDIGECSDLDANNVNWISRKLPGLDSSGCGAFEIGNVSFVSLNSVALLCDNNSLRFDVEKVIERESLELREESETAAKTINYSTRARDVNYNFFWRESTMLSGSGPVLLLHLPLDQTRNERYAGTERFKRSSSSFIERLNVVSKNRDFVGTGLYNLLHTLPLNASEYILQALRPRIIFSAHRCTFSDHVHFDTTREIIVPAMSWNARDDPGFVIATFQKTGKSVSISYCSLARESHILIIYFSIIVLFCLACLKG